MSVAILSPHLDDAVLSAWNVLRGPGAAVVVNVCDGVPPRGTLGAWDERTGASDSADRMRERLAEDRVALEIAGRRAVSLGFVEAQYRDGPLDADELAERLAAAVGDADEVWAPAGIGAHGDHLQVRDWALAACGATLRLYAELPYAVREGWPEWVVDGAPRRAPGSAWEPFLPQGVALEPRIDRLAPAEVDLKLRAMAAYLSQVEGMDRYAGGHLRRPEVIALEVSWAVSP